MFLVISFIDNVRTQHLYGFRMTNTIQSGVADELIVIGKPNLGT